MKRWSSLAEVPWLILTHLFPDDSAFPPGAFPVSSENAPVLAELYYTRKKDLFHPVWGKRFGRIRTALFDGPDKYIDSSDGNHELYNLDSDPGERDNLVDVRPERAKELQDRLAAFKASWKTAPPQETPSAPEQALRDEMKALGYLE